MIYLDYSATTPLDPAVFKKMQPFFSRNFANPASIHSLGQSALKAVDDCRYAVADLLETTANELVFTSGATEANNLVLRGITEGIKDAHIITTPIEHDSILEPCHYLERRGVKTSYVSVNKKGIVKPEDIIKLMTDKTILVSIGYVNAETGVVQPIKKIGRLIKAHNERRYKAWLNTSPRKREPKPQTVYFHTDATQAANFFDCRVPQLQVDLMSLSGHKIYGPKGVGLLYVKTDTPLEAVQYGGHQERNLRSGTLNVPAIIGFGAALNLAVKHREVSAKKIATLRNSLARSLRKRLPKIVINTPLTDASPSHLNLSLPGLEADLIVASLDEEGLAASTGSACASGDNEPSHVLEAMKLTDKIKLGSIRLTLGKHTTAKDIQRTVTALANVERRLRLRR